MTPKLAIALTRGLSMVSLVLLLLFACKKSDSNNGTAYDPSKPVSISRITPDSGGVSTQLVIYGSNFGRDTSQIKVYVNDRNAPVISSNGSAIYALVPSRAGT